MVPRRIALVCLLPDAGHAIPLARIGRVLARAGHEVHAYGPTGARKHFEAASIPTTALGEVPVLRDELVRHQRYRPRLRSVRSPIYKASFEYPREDAMYREVGVLADRVRDTGRYDLAIVDSQHHTGPLGSVFGPTPTVVNESTGSLPFADEGRRIVERFGRRSSRLHRLGALVKALHPRARFGPRKTPADPPSVAPVGRLSSGLAHSIQRSMPTAIVDADLLVLGALPSHQEPVLPVDLEDWVRAHRVIYVSFGSMVLPRRRTLERLADALSAQTEHAVLWASSERPPIPLSEDRFRWMEWAPQAALLAHPHVELFVTNGGSGGLQEAALGATPMLVLPVYADQFHNALVVEELGLGAALDQRTASVEALRGALSSALQPSVARRAAGVRDELLGSQAEEKLLSAVERWIRSA